MNQTYPERTRDYMGTRGDRIVCSIIDTAHLESMMMSVSYRYNVKKGW